jgi:hypothetical protein
MFKKEIMPGVMLYRPDFDFKGCLDLIKKLEIEKYDLLFKEWDKWGFIPDYYKTNINFQKISENSEHQILKDFVALYDQYFYEYLSDVKETDYLPDFIDYSGNKNWVYDGGMLQKHKGISEEDYTETESKLGLSFHLDLATSDRGPGYKHIFTGNFYFNDDYKRGEILFAIKKSLKEDDYSEEKLNFFQFKPQAGDFIFYPANFAHAVYRAIDEDRYLTVATCKYRVSEGEDMSMHIPKDMSNINRINHETDGIKFIDSKDIK